MAEHVPIERYPPAYGLYMLLAGAISLGVGPLIGKDFIFYFIKLLYNNRRQLLIKILLDVCISSIDELIMRFEIYVVEDIFLKSCLNAIK